MTPPGACCAVGLVDWRLPEPGAPALTAAARAGADGVQLDLGGPGRAPFLDAPGTLDAVRDAAARTGVAVLAVSANTVNDLGLTAEPGTVEARQVRDVLVRALDAARTLGAPLVMVPSFRRSAVTSPRALARTGEVLAWAATEAEARGLALASENVLDADRAARLVRHVGSASFRLLLDFYNLRQADVGVPPLLAAVPPERFAEQLHLKDGVAGEVRGTLLGEGDGRLAETLSTVRRRLGVRALVLENDYRDGDDDRLAADLRWARRQAASLSPRQPDRGTVA